MKLAKVKQVIRAGALTDRMGVRGLPWQTPQATEMCSPPVLEAGVQHRGASRVVLPPERDPG